MKNLARKKETADSAATVKGKSGIFQMNIKMSAVVMAAIMTETVFLAVTTDMTLTDGITGGTMTLNVTGVTETQMADAGNTEEEASAPTDLTAATAAATAQTEADTERTDAALTMIPAVLKGPDDIQAATRILTNINIAHCRLCRLLLCFYGIASSRASSFAIEFEKIFRRYKEIL